MEPGPSSASPDPHPPPDRWAVAPDADVVGADAPKVAEWEELQEELARVWSLSSAAAASGDRRARLAARLEPALEARKAFLQQENELAEMRQRLQEHVDLLGDLNMRRRELSVSVEDRRDKLHAMIRNLSLAGKTLETLGSNMQESDKSLSAEIGHDRLKELRRVLRMRQQYMIAQVTQIYPVRPLHEQSTVEKPSLNSSIIRTGDAESVSLNGSRIGQIPLAILGLQLSKPSMKKTSYFSDKTEIQESATALGYVAHAVSLISSYLDVPLRYPLRLGGSHSYVLDHAPSVEPSSITSGVSSTPMGMSTRTVEFPLFFDGQETTRSAYAVFLLNKNIEQLLNHIGAESLGPRHVLANLKQLTDIIQSPQYISD